MTDLMIQVRTRPDLLKLTRDSKNALSVIYFTKPQCPYCTAIQPKFEELMRSEEYKNRADYYHVDIFDDLADEFGIYSAPNFVFYKDGDIITSVAGAKLDELKNAFEKAFKDVPLSL